MQGTFLFLLSLLVPTTEGNFPPWDLNIIIWKLLINRDYDKFCRTGLPHVFVMPTAVDYRCSSWIEYRWLLLAVFFVWASTTADIGTWGRLTISRYGTTFTQSAENRRKQCHRFWLRLGLISNDWTSASKKINEMVLIRTLKVSTVSERMKGKIVWFLETVLLNTSC